MNKPELEKQEIAKRFKKIILAMGSLTDKIKSIAQQVSETTQGNNKKRLKDIQSIYERNLQDARDTYSQTCASLQKQIEKIKSGFDYQQKEWTDPSWRAFESPEFLDSHQLIRIGVIYKKHAYGDIEIPLLVPVMGYNNVLIKACGEHKEKAIRLLQTIAMRMLVSVPAGKLKFTFIDPVGHGKNFGRFVDLPDTIFEGKIWVEKHHIQDKLMDFSKHIVDVNQIYLKGDRFKNIEEYNKEMKIINEPYRVLVVSDFPEGFDTDTARRLVSIADNGVRTGVYLLVMVDTGKKNLYDFGLYDLERKCLNLVYNSNCFLQWINSPLPDCELHTDNLPDENISDTIIRQISRASEKIEQVKLPFKGVTAELSDQMWKGNASEEISVPIGKSGVRTQYFSIGDKEHHALITGKIGKGKSIFLHNLIVSMALHYSPNELEFYLIDLKEGVEFNRYAEYKLPHARAVGIETEREFAFSILKKLNMEFKRRLELFKDTDPKITKLFHYNKKRPESKLPRIVLIVDEFQRLFTENDNMSEEISQVLDILVKQARNAGINIIMASQVLDRAIFSKKTETQMGIRVAFQCSEDESRIILGEGNTEAATLKRPGEGIYNDDNRRIEKNSRFQASWLSEDDSVGYLLQIQDEAQKHSYESQDRLIIFDGRKPGTIFNNNKFMNIINEPAWHESPKICHAWLGESISIKPDTCATFKRQGGSNLLLVGMNDTAILSMIFASILSITAQQSPEHVEFYIINPLGQDHSCFEFLSEIHFILDQYAVRIVNQQKEIPGMISDLHTIFKEQSQETATRMNLSIYLILIGIHRTITLRRSDFDLSEGAQMLEEIFLDGPDAGIHTIMWSDTSKSIRRIFDKALNHFDMRVVQKMNPDDSHILIDSPLAGKLKDLQAFYYDYNHSDNLEKFKPYDLSNLSDFNTLFSQIRRKEFPE